MNRLTFECALQILIDFCQDKDCTIENRIFVESELERIFMIYNKDYKFKNFIDNEIGGWLYKKMHRTRSMDKNSKIFRNHLTQILGLILRKFDQDECNEIDKKYILDDLEGYLLGYIHIRNLNQDDLEIDTFQINFVIHNIRLCKKQEFFRVFKSVPTLQNPNPEFVTVAKTIESVNPKLKLKYIQSGQEIYAIQFQKINPYNTIFYALNDPEYFRKYLDLFTDYEKFFRFKDDIQDKIKRFVEKEKQNNISIFQSSKDGVLPLITKDVVNMINDYIYNELDLNKMIRKISLESERMYDELCEEIEKDIHFKILSIKMVKCITNFMTSISKIRKIRDDLPALMKNKYFYIYDQLKIISYFLSLLETDFGKKFLEANNFLKKSLTDKVTEYKKEVFDLEKQGVDVDWILPLTNSFQHN